MGVIVKTTCYKVHYKTVTAACNEQTAVKGCTYNFVTVTSSLILTHPVLLSVLKTQHSLMPEIFFFFKSHLNHNFTLRTFVKNN